MTSEENERILKTGEILNRKYIVEKYLGGGAFGEVYRVKHRLLKNRRAVKVFKVALDLKGSGSSIEELLDEAILLTRFDHRNIVKVHDADSFKGKDGEEHVFFVMDLVPGGDLDDYWKSFGSSYMPLDNVIDIIKQICHGLNVLHSENPPMIHRDIKPQNIMIGYDDQGIVAKLTDFGLVKAVNPTTMYASAKGTLAFKAPEYLEEKDDTSTDIFALGVTFYMLLTDKLPYPIDSDFDVMTGSWLKQKPKPINYYNPLINDEELERIVFKSISVDAKNRYQTAQELLDAIEQWEKSNSDAVTEKVDTPQKVETEENVAYASINKDPKKSNKDTQQNIYTKEEVEVKVEKAKELSKDPDKWKYASDALQEAFKHNNDVRVEHQENLEIINSENPPELLVENALKSIENSMDYDKAIDYIEQAFAREPELKSQYSSKYELWKSLTMINNPNSTSEGIDALLKLVNEDDYIKGEYGFASNLLSSKDAKKIEKEALKYIDNYDTKKASNLIEIAMLMDENIKDNYKYKLKNWRKGLIY